jgi:hypothetical protein
VLSLKCPIWGEEKMASRLSQEMLSWGMMKVKQEKISKGHQTGYDHR